MFSTKLLLSLAGLLLINVCQAQNLVPNPSFESGSCVTGVHRCFYMVLPLLAKRYTEIRKRNSYINTIKNK